MPVGRQPRFTLTSWIGLNSQSGTRPPYITFKMERHGGTSFGSTCGEIYEYWVNLETGAVDARKGGLRQIRPQAKKLDTNAIAQELVKTVESKEQDPRVKYRDEKKRI